MTERPSWEEVGAWFHRLVELDASERRSRLSELETRDPVLAEEVRALLDADAQTETGGRLEPGDLQASELWDEMAEALEDGRRKPRAAGVEELRAGPFLLGKVLGRGGMAVVHLGERVDDDFRQLVAVKRLSGVDRRGVTQRLLAERRILAELRHPNIAQLIDGGTDSSGRPYLALEYVEGQPIDAYCESRRLGLDERIALFRQACAAVAYAHRQLVVHRDLKPSNILVDERGVVKLLDFGIAKILDPQRDAGLTLREVRPLTPRYAAPEQFLGAPSTTATDVYGLGIVLYELLVGCLPYEVTGSDLSSYRRAVLEQAPSAPDAMLDTLSLRNADTTELERIASHRRTSVRALRRRLRGDLRAIFEKVLHKEPEQRYLSVEEFSEDLQRFLEGRPVSAIEWSRAYVARRFVARHRLGLTFATLFLATLIGGAVGIWLQAEEARRQAVRAVAEQERAVRVKDLMAAIIGAADPDRLRQEQITAGEFLDRGVEAALGRLEEDPLVVGEFLREISIIYRRVGDLERAREYAGRVVEVLRAEVPEAPELSQALHHLGLVHADRGEFDEAEAVLLEVLDREAGRFRSGQPSTAFGAVPDQRPYALATLGKVEIRRGRSDQATDYLERALRRLDESGVTDHSLRDTIQSDLAFLQVRAGAHEDARANYLAILERGRERHGPRSLMVSPTIFNLGRIELELGNFDAAVDYFEESVSIDTEVYGENSPRLAPDLAFLGEVERRRGDAEGALRWFRRVAEVTEDSALQEPNRMGALSNLARALVDSAEALDTSSAAERREALAREALEVVTQVAPALMARFDDPANGRVLSTEFSRLRATRILESKDVTPEVEALLGRATERYGAEHRFPTEVARWLAQAR